jgi:topoisomerase-4 subunit B
LQPPPPPLPRRPWRRLHETRRLLPVAFGPLGVPGTVQSLTRLMGKGEAQSRRELMELHGDAVEVDV